MIVAICLSIFSDLLFETYITAKGTEANSSASLQLLITLMQ